MDKGVLSQKTECFLRGLYEGSAPLTELLAGVNFREFSWIGTGKNTFLIPGTRWSSGGKNGGWMRSAPCGIWRSCSSSSSLCQTR